MRPAVAVAVLVCGCCMLLFGAGVELWCKDDSRCREWVPLARLILIVWVSCAALLFVEWGGERGRRAGAHW